GTAGLGIETIKHLAAHSPAHIYFSGRNSKAGDTLVAELGAKYPDVGFTFVQMDLSSLASIKNAVEKCFTHSRLDILVNNAGIMAMPPALSTDGYEIQFATNHLGHAMLLRQLLPTLLKTAEQPGTDVRVISLSSLGFRGHPLNGIEFAKLEAGSTLSLIFMGSWIRYGQSKLANILYASELARLHPSITSISVHPGVVKTPLVSSQKWYNRWFIYVSQFLIGVKLLEPEQGAWNTVWAASAAKKEDLRNGGFYTPVGVDGWKSVLDKTARNEELAAKLWVWTEGILKKH
ncbi:hypothetical protein B0J11DRAFT_423914, partial [Dendryphion nanum]